MGTVRGGGEDQPSPLVAEIAEELGACVASPIWKKFADEHTTDSGDRRKDVEALLNHIREEIKDPKIIRVGTSFDGANALKDVADSDGDIVGGAVIVPHLDPRMCLKMRPRLEILKGLMRSNFNMLFPKFVEPLKIVGKAGETALITEEGATEKFLQTIGIDPADSEAVKKWLKEENWFSGATFAKYFMTNWVLDKTLREIEVPVLAILAEEDKVIDPSLQRKKLENIPDVQIKTLPSANHFDSIDPEAAWKETRAHLKTFFEKCFDS